MGVGTFNHVLNFQTCINFESENENQKINDWGLRIYHGKKKYPDKI